MNLLKSIDMKTVDRVSKEVIVNNSSVVYAEGDHVIYITLNIELDFFASYDNVILKLTQSTLNSGDFYLYSTDENYNINYSSEIKTFFINGEQQYRYIDITSLLLQNIGRTKHFVIAAKNTSAGKLNIYNDNTNTSFLEYDYSKNYDFYKR